MKSNYVKVAVLLFTASAEVVADLQDEMLEEAEECIAAKRALRKISILCYK